MPRSIQITLTAEEMPQAIGEYLYEQGRLPTALEEGSIVFKSNEDGSFVIDVIETGISSTLQ